MRLRNRERERERWYIFTLTRFIEGSSAPCRDGLINMRVAIQAREEYQLSSRHQGDKVVRAKFTIHFERERGKEKALSGFVSEFYCCAIHKFADSLAYESMVIINIELSYVRRRAHVG